MLIETHTATKDCIFCKRKYKTTTITDDGTDWHGHQRVKPSTTVNDTCPHCNHDILKAADIYRADLAKITDQYNNKYIVHAIKYGKDAIYRYVSDKPLTIARDMVYLLNERTLLQVIECNAISAEQAQTEYSNLEILPVLHARPLYVNKEELAAEVIDALRIGDIDVAYVLMRLLKALNVNKIQGFVQAYNRYMGDYWRMIQPTVARLINVSKRVDATKL